MTHHSDSITRLFPGDGYSIPDEAEWQRAEELLRSDGIDIPLDRNHPNPTSSLTTPAKGNLAHLRAQLRRAYRRRGYAL